MGRVRIACVQLSPVFKDVAASIARADSLMAEIAPGEIDMLILPEMAFTGYCFESRTDIERFTEDPERSWEKPESPTSVWGANTARRLQCYVLVGFPQRRCEPNNSEDTFYNSLMIINPDGTLHTNYQKHFLYETDEKWSAPGPSFIALDLPLNGSTFRLIPCICMDLNPCQFTAPFDAYELGTFGKEQRADLIVCSMAWLDSSTPEEEEEMKSEWDRVRRTISYWVARLDPLIGSGTMFVGCNRVGQEGDVTFTGSSCILTLEELPTVLCNAPKRGEALLIGEVELAGS